MTVPSSTNIVTYLGDGVSTVFPITFPVNQPSDITVYSQVISTGVLTPVVPSSVTLTAVTLSAPLANGSKLYVVRQAPLTQLVDILNQGGFYPEAVEQGLDTLAMQIQQNAEKMSRALTVQLGDSIGPLPYTRANLWLGFDGSGNPVGLAAPTVSVTLADSSITLAKFVPIAANSILGNNTGGATIPAALTTAQVATMLPAFTGDTGTGGVKGLVPAPGVGDATKFLKGDGTYATPPGSGGSGTTSSSLTFNNGGAGAASGTTFDGSVGRTISYNSIGAAPLTSPTFLVSAAGPTPTVGDNSTKLATTAFVKTAIDALINAAPGSLDTLKELADALGDDANYAATTTAALAGKAAARPTVSAVSASFTAVDADNNTHKVLSSAAQTMTLGNITAGTAFTGRASTAWSVACAGGVSKNGASPVAVTTATIAAGSLFTVLHEGAGVWELSGSGVS